MANLFKLHKGLDINLFGKATAQVVSLKERKEIAIVPEAFQGVIPKMLVHEGDKVKAGEPLFCSKKCPEVLFSSPLGGKVVQIERGERRKVLSVKVAVSQEQEVVDFGTLSLEKAKAEDVVARLLQAGLFGFIKQLPFDIVTEPDTKPKAIFISALRDKPLAMPFEKELEIKGSLEAFQAGLTALSRVAKTYLSIGSKQQGGVLANMRDVEVNVFQGSCPAGNVGVQINHISPVNKGEVVWTVDPTAVIFFGRLFLTGKVDLRRRIAVVGSVLEAPSFLDVVVGESVGNILNSFKLKDQKPRIIDGNVLTGKCVGRDGYLGAFSSELTVIPEGDDADELAGWIMPRFKQFSVSRSYFSWLFPKKRQYALDARIKGGKRHIIMSGEYDKVLPMDILGEYLIKAIISGNIDKMEALGIYEVSPEDFALAEFVDSSKLELQRIVRQGLDLVRKETL